MTSGGRSAMFVTDQAEKDYLQEIVGVAKETESNAERKVNRRN